MSRDNDKSVLIVGDSFIDENWLMSRGDNYHSYNVGKQQYVSNLDRTDSRILSFCGVASILRILQGVHKPDEATARVLLPHKLYALSAWNPMDGDLLRCLLCNHFDALKGLTPYRLSGPSLPRMDGVCHLSDDKQKCSYQPMIYNIVDDKKKDAILHSSSNRLIRLYEGFGSDQPRLHSRFDWRIKLKGAYKNYNIIDGIKEDIKNSDVEAIIVLDHGYGVVDETLVTRLHDGFPNARWYVRCKLTSPPWLKKLAGLLDKSKRSLRLRFTDEQWLDHRYGVRSWRHGPIVLGRGALEVLGDLLGLPKYKNQEKRVSDDAWRADYAALLYDDDTVIAGSRCDASKDNDAVLINNSKAPGDKQPIRVGRSTVFFASLVYWDLMKNAALRGIPGTFQEACDWALQNAYAWTANCSKAWLRKEPADLSGPFDRAIYRDVSLQIKHDDESSGGGDPLQRPNDAPEAAPGPEATPAIPGVTVQPMGPLYEESWNEWNQSSAMMGILGGDDRQIQLWRAEMWRFQGKSYNFICPGGPKRDAINDFIRKVKIYSDKDAHAYPLNCLFLAEPGW
jgi:hypothetical protein